METIECFADETVFRNDENGYTVLVVKCGKTRVSAVGVMPSIAPGEKMKITGEWVEHPVYGRQIKVQAVEIEKPTTLSGIEKYLSSGMIRGVGPATAKLLGEIGCGVTNHGRGGRLHGEKQIDGFLGKAAVGQIIGDIQCCLTEVTAAGGLQFAGAFAFKDQLDIGSQIRRIVIIKHRFPPYSG